VDDETGGREVENDLEELKAGVLESLPEINDIEDATLRDQVIEVHALALAETEYERVSDMPLCDPGEAPLPRGTQADHYRAVARMSVALTDELEHVMGDLGIDRDLLIAAALCHDVGKAYEFSPHNRERWEKDSGKTGNPAVRHPAYGAHLALIVGLPEAVVHCAAAHPMYREGSYVEVSLETKIVQYADLAFWDMLEKAGVVPEKTPPEAVSASLER
jgi:putative nucleotidyltransferase with HDIG domain